MKKIIDKKMAIFNKEKEEYEKKYGKIKRKRKKKKGRSRKKKGDSDSDSEMETESEEEEFPDRPDPPKKPLTMYFRFMVATQFSLNYITKTDSISFYLQNSVDLEALKFSYSEFYSF